MAIGAGASRRVAIISETTYGVTPATPTFKNQRITGGGPRTNKVTGQSDEINLDRNVRDEFMLGQDVAGDYNFELSYSSLDDFLEAVLQGAWTTNVLKNGTTEKSFTIEETMDLKGGSYSYSRFAGMMANTMSLAINARGKITGSVGLIGKKETLDTAIIAGATYTPANTEPVLTSSAHVAALTVAGGTPKVKSMSLQITNNLRTREVVGSLYTEQPGSGMFEVTGTLECYFESNVLYQSVLDHGSGALSFTVGKDANKKYTLLLPKIIFGNGERNPGGRDDDFMLSLPFRGVYDTTEACSMKVTRAVA